MLIGIALEPTDKMRHVRGIGGTEVVFTKTADNISIGDLLYENVQIQIGEMDYGFEIDGIIGMNFLQKVRAVIDFERMEISVGRI